MSEVLACGLSPVAHVMVGLRCCQPARRVMTNVSTLAPVGGKPVMVMRSLRVPLKLWEAAKAKADEREENISDVLRAALEAYVKRK